MLFRVLGPFEVLDSGGREVKIDRRQVRSLLAILVLEAGHTVPASRLCELLWDQEPPPAARATLRTYTSRIRDALARAAGAADGVTLSSGSGGYRLDVPVESIDAHVFRSLVAQARAAEDLAERERLLHKAVTSWRGPAFADLPDPLRRRLGADLDELRLVAIETLVGTGLARGRHRELLPELARLIVEYPTSERLIGLQMLALHRSGRTTEALDRYARARAYLADELGLDPGPELQRLHAAILRGDHAPADPAAFPDAMPGLAADLTKVVDALVRLAPALAAERRPQALAHTEIRQYRFAGPDRTRCRLGLVTGTIRRVTYADAWVNSENTDLEMSRFTDFSVSGIIRYWGARRDRAGRVVDDVIADELGRAVSGRRPVAPATAVVTGAGALTASHNLHYIIHVAAVAGVPGFGYQQVPNIGDCAINVLVEAERLVRNGKPARTILFPLLGTGSAGAHPIPTARTLVDTTVSYLIANSDTGLAAIHFLAYTDEELAAIEQAFAAVPGLIPDEPTAEAS